MVRLPAEPHKKSRRPCGGAGFPFYRNGQSEQNSMRLIRQLEQTNSNWNNSRFSLFSATQAVVFVNDLFRKLASLFPGFQARIRLQLLDAFQILSEKLLLPIVFATPFGPHLCGSDMNRAFCPKIQWASFAFPNGLDTWLHRNTSCLRKTAWIPSKTGRAVKASR